MSVDAILQELPNLETADLRRIRDLLNSIEDQRNAEHMAEMARLIDDKDPSHWVTLEELKRS
ncbi:MAG: hypothetical protein WDO13_00975 [Verrucomicrobiota bacterium]